MRLLLIEDDHDTAAYLVKGLSESGHTVDHTPNGEDGLHRASQETYDALVVDRMLPGRDGLSLIAELRGQGNHTPILILSALGEVDDRVEGLSTGADDYLAKPYALSEVMARLSAIVRRVNPAQAAAKLRVIDLELDTIKRKVTRAGEAVALQPREFRLLEYLMRHAGQVVTRTMLLENVWDYHFDPQTNVIDVQISRLRSKIDKGFDKPLLHTVRGAGYTLDAKG
ncbi:MAG: response regulator transcription factor [Gammaproteobacteria bacterium]